MKANEGPIRPECPRCGYDLSGSVASWADTCPLSGRCSECGFDLYWRDIIKRPRHPWLIEHQLRRRPLKSILRTLSSSFLPRALLTSVHPFHQIKITPLLILIGALVAVSIGIVVYDDAYWTIRLYRPVDIESFLNGFGQYLQGTWRRFGDFILERVPGATIVVVGMPVALYGFTSVRKTVDYRKLHMFRIWLYSLIAPLLLLAMWTAGWVIIHQMNWITVFFDARRIWDPYWWPWRNDLYVIWDAIVGIGLTLIAAIWTWRWWTAAFRQYLQIERPERLIGISLLLLVMTGIVIHARIGIV